MKQFAVLSTFIHSVLSADLFELDSTWQPVLPSGAHTYSAVGVYHPTGSSVGTVFITQRGNTSIPPVLAVSTNGTLLDMWGQNDVGIAPAKPGKSSTWGAHGLAVENCGYPCTNAQAQNGVRVWIEDFTNHTVTSFDAKGQKLLQVGVPGVAGNGTDPIQFGNVADAYIEPGSAMRPSHVYATDGDGGSANRVVKFAVPAQNTRGVPLIEWATSAQFHNPHSIAFHERTRLLIVADRENAALKLISADDGEVLGAWDCDLNFPAQGVPFGVRTLVRPGLDLLLVASMDNPQDHKFQRISVLDVSELTTSAGVHSNCSLLQTITIDPDTYSGPHLLGVDESTGDIYAALVADVPKSTVLRFKFKN